MSYIDWGYYSSLYNTVAEANFERLNAQASARLDVLTHMRAKEFVLAYDEDTATPFQQQVHTQIMNTTCEIVNALYVQDNASARTGISSVSNDGYSESYTVTTQADKDKQLLDVVRGGLSGTGLAGAL